VKAPAAILLGCLLAGAAGCSDDRDEPGRSVTIRAGDPVEVKADEYHFDPGRILVESGGRDVRLQIVLSNRGSLAHNLHVRDGDRDLAGLRSFSPGERRPLSVNLQPGEYDFICTVADHEELGMRGTLEIR
jgi:plastocyanin